MPTRYPEILVLTPRGGIYNHRFAVAAGSSLDADGCGRIYRAAKGALGEAASGGGRLDGPDGASFAAATHVVAQREAARRQGAEWLIVVDPRIGGLDSIGRERLERDLADRLSRLSHDVLDRVHWDEHSAAEVVQDETLASWLRQIVQQFADASPPEPRRPGPKPLPEGSRSRPVAKLALGGVVVALIAVGIGLMLAGRHAVPPADDLLGRVAKVLGTQPNEKAVVDGLARFFTDRNSRLQHKAEKLLNDMRAAAGSRDGSADLQDDEGFWEKFTLAFSSTSGPAGVVAFLSEEDRRVVVGLSGPEVVHRLAENAIAIGRLDTEAARPDDDNLKPLFNSLVTNSSIIDRENRSQVLRIFTPDDAALARKLLPVFQDHAVAKSIETHTGQRVADSKSLADWIDALGRPARNGLYSDHCFESMMAMAQANDSIPKQDAVRLLWDFCKICRERVRERPGAPAPGAGGPRRPPASPASGGSLPSGDERSPRPADAAP